ncbi:Do family serine endopeptidase [Thiocapsa bogorovii]|uniref:Do family serine endopeptidase n=1 Tax=Thiocapsa bogorovii TaxID=521689 RepID=UPI001E5B440C|nr:Do family serine endopeptidase [Thiocapsa bogorovii]UHD18169.1 Do family serine endopeptidase [Thiocapsa bogorovii]
MSQRRITTPTRSIAVAPRLPLRHPGLVSATLALALASGALYWSGRGAVAADQPIPADARAASAAFPSFADVAERVTPAVVNVSVKAESVQPTGLRGHPTLPPDADVPESFRRFFEQPGRAMPRQVTGQGSGFIVDSDGHIVTNFHVIEGAGEVTVVLNDGTSHVARVVGRDPKTDLALLKIDVDRPLVTVQIGDSSTARVGDWVLAVGNPFGLGGSVNAGIISARGRDINSGPYDDYLQIDAPINRGNSGGPLFDIAGRVIGVNTAIFSPTGGNVGIGFAIPAETVERVVASLRENGRVERGWLGVQIQPVTEELAAGLGLDEATGVLIADLIPGSPAAASDLRTGDVILSASGQQLTSAKDLSKLVAGTKAGTPMTLRLMRDGKARDLTLTIGPMPQEDRIAAMPSEDAAESDRPRLGLYLSPLTPELRAERGLDADAAGVFVAQVEADSPADRAGVEAGSLISMVGTESVDTPDQVVAAVREAIDEKRDSLILRVEKDGRPLFIAVPFAT